MARFVDWAARIIAIAAIVLISLFALDEIGLDRPLRETALAFLVHLLPSIVLLAILIVAWRIAWLGGVLYVIAGLSPFVVLSNPAWVNLMLGGPFMLAGALFLTAYGLSRSGDKQP